MLRCVFDTNTVLSGLFWKGPPHRLLLKALDSRLKLFTSEPLVAELRDVLQRRKFEQVVVASNLTVDQLVRAYLAVAEMVTPASIPRTASDPDDDIVLGTAAACAANFVVSGDEHLIVLRDFRGISIVSAADCLNRHFAAEER